MGEAARILEPLIPSDREAGWHGLAGLIRRIAESDPLLTAAAVDREQREAELAAAEWLRRASHGLGDVVMLAEHLVVDGMPFDFDSVQATLESIEHDARQRKLAFRHEFGPVIRMIDRRDRAAARRAASLLDRLTAMMDEVIRIYHRFRGRFRALAQQQLPGAGESGRIAKASVLYRRVLHRSMGAEIEKLEIEALDGYPIYRLTLRVPEELYRDSERLVALELGAHDEVLRQAPEAVGVLALVYKPLGHAA